MAYSKEQLEPSFHPDTKEKWWQLCFICSEQINFLKAGKESYVHVGTMVRHRKCYPPPAK